MFGEPNITSPSAGLGSRVQLLPSLRIHGAKILHTDCIRAPFAALFESATAEPPLRSVLDFCRLTKAWLDELKLSEACRFIAGIMI